MLWLCYKDVCCYVCAYGHPLKTDNVQAITVVPQIHYNGLMVMEKGFEPKLRPANE